MTAARRRPPPETAIARVMVDGLTDLGWDVYQEVQPEAYGGVADIVGVRQQGAARLVWVVECKVSLGLAVLDQAWGWLGRAHYVSVAAPPLARHRRIVEALLRDRGIGLFEVNMETWHPDRAIEVVPARLHRVQAAGLLKALRPEHRTYAEAGNAEGKRWTPFTATCEEVRRVVAMRPGVTLTELLAQIRHHYRSVSTARSSLAKWAVAGAIKGVRASIPAGESALRLYPSP